MIGLSWARSPHSVRKWDSFIKNASEMPVDNTTPQFDKPSFLNIGASAELSVQVSLQANVFRVLSATIGALQPSKEEFDFPHSAFVRVQGNPDFVLEAGGNLIVPIEVKTKFILPEDNIVEIFNAEHPPVGVVDSIRQIFGYMAHNKRRFGVLSTYDKTWFVRRGYNDPGALYISDAVNQADSSPTLLRCFAYIMLLARQDCYCPYPAPSPPRSVGEYHESGEEAEAKEPTYQPPKGISSRFRSDWPGIDRASAGKKGIRSKRNELSTRGKRGGPPDNRWNRRELRLENFDWGSYEVTDYLGEGLTGTVFEGTLRGERVAIKLTDLWHDPLLHKAMLREARAYVKMEYLQGHGIPKLKGVGYTAGGLFALIMEFVGMPIEVEYLDDNMREMIVGVLASIHAEGILHGDVRSDNILVKNCHDGPRITFIDFGFSRKFSSRNECVREMAGLKKMIRFP
jgi:hypothetical protein